ncbi:MAG: GT4 family glycosyltransferase PelF [Candidatus Omnitrophica bacterium]|nr:GT4 family glycosyltransferase PelF [Candidatus Omnitrophota bacterium]
MNILQILPELKVGGVETGTLDLAKYLVRLGHKAVVISGGGELVKELESVGAIHYELPVQEKSIFKMIKMIPRIAEIIKKENIDIVHARSRSPAWSAYFASRRTGTIFITTCHGYYRKHPFSQVMGWGKRVIALSNVIARHMIDDFGVPHQRIRLVPRSVDLEKYKFLSPDKRRKDEFNVGIIGRITPIKGHLHFIKAMAKVARVIPRLKIWIIGDAPESKQAYKEEAQVLVKRLGLWHCTEFLGTQRDIPEILSHLDLLVLATTTHEAFGRVIIEAQAAGVPVVATEVGGVVDIIEQGKTGLLVPPADPNSMAGAIIKILKDPELARVLAENAYKKVREQYNVELMVKNTLAVYQEALTNFKILIIKFSSLGDIILSTAAIKAIREKFAKGYKISFLVGEGSKEALLRCPYIDELLVADFKGKDKGIKGLLRLGGELRRQNFDLVIDLQNNRTSHILSYLSASINRYGYDNKKFGFLLNHRIKDLKQAIPPVTHQFEILKMLGIEPNNTSLELWPSEDDKQYIEELLGAHWLSAQTKIIGINVSASVRWETKNWPLQQMAKLCCELGKRDLRIVVTGTEKDAAQAQALINMAGGAKIINTCAKTSVNQLAALMKKCAVFISMDSSPLHIAAAQGVPFVGLFGPTDPRRHLPPAAKYAVIRKDLPCSPCYKPKCKNKKCMELITAEEVLAEVDKLLL